ncbi:MAG: hypothetical protein IPL28_16835 [Chloroflexi bacterium]|nr:hypothetical protein [Chloroflexota bacterium]
MRAFYWWPDTHQFTGTERDPKDENGRDWLRTFLASNGDMVDVVAVHRYPFPASMGAGSPKIEDLRANSAEWEQIIPALRAAVLEETGKELPIAITEVNSNWTSVGSGEATPDSHFSALWWEDVMGRLINHQVDMVAHFALYSNPNMGAGACWRGLSHGRVITCTNSTSSLGRSCWRPNRPCPT